MEYAYDARKDKPYVSNISQTRENSYSEKGNRCSQLLLSRWIYKTGCQVSPSSFIKLSLQFVDVVLFSFLICSELDGKGECSKDSHCSSSKRCVGRTCLDLCPDACGFNSVCRMANHLPVCTCSPGHTGNPYE